jgi:hypothetical protein
MELEQTTNLLDQSIDILSQAPIEQENWLKQVGSILTKWGELENYSIMAQSKVLYNVWSIWKPENNDYGVSLSIEVTGLWDYDFYKWAKVYSRSNAIEPSHITIGNKISVYRDYKGQELIEYPEYVEIPIRDDLGNETGEIERKQFDIMECNYSKLLVCRNKARKGEMTQEHFNALADAHVSVNKFKTLLEQKEIPPKNDDFRIFEKDGFICAYENGKVIELAQILYENGSNQTFLRGLNHLSQVLSLKMDIGRIF